MSNIQEQSHLDLAPWWQNQEDFSSNETDVHTQQPPLPILQQMLAPSAPPVSNHPSEQADAFNADYLPPPPYLNTEQASVVLKKDQWDEQTKRPIDLIQLCNLGFDGMEELADYINNGHQPFNELRLTDNNGQAYSLVAMFNPERPNRLALHKKPLYVSPGVEAIATPISKAESELWREQVASSFVDLGHHIQNKSVETEGFVYQPVMTIVPSAPPALEPIPNMGPTCHPVFNSYQPAISAPLLGFNASPAYNPQADEHRLTAF